MQKTKFKVSGVKLGTFIKSGTWSQAVCQLGMGSNSTYCLECKHRVHKKCSRICGTLDCDWYCGLASTIEGHLVISSQWGSTLIHSATWW